MKRRLAEEIRRLSKLKKIKTQHSGVSDSLHEISSPKTGIDESVINDLSLHKKEPVWMQDFRKKSFAAFQKIKLPEWGPDLSGLNFNELRYYIDSTNKKTNKWKEVPAKIKDTFEKLGIPQAERRFLAGVAAQYESEIIYNRLKEEWKKLGVVFMDTDTAYKKYPILFKKYFSKIIPYTDNKFAALNSAVWSGGSFIYVPKGVHVKVPLQAYFRINVRNMGQFERTLIIADEGSSVHYIEGCTAPIYSTDSLHSGVVEVVVEKNARVRYTTLQNWSTNVYNLVTKRALVRENGIMEWVDCNLGSKVTMKYPAVYLAEPYAHGEVLSMAMAGKGQHIDSGGKAVHIAPYTTSIINSKSISMNGGRSSYRGLVKAGANALHSSSKVTCDALIMDNESQTDTYPLNIVENSNIKISHEAKVSKLDEEQLFYLLSRGLSPEQAGALIVSGFIEPVVKELPMEYALELNALINMSMEGSVA